MVGAGMIFEETYRPLFEQLRARRPFSPRFRPGRGRAGRGRQQDRDAGGKAQGNFGRFPELLRTRRGPANAEIAARRRLHRHPRRPPLRAGSTGAGGRKHVLIEKPSVLRLQDFDALFAPAHKNHVLAKVVYHKLADPDHKKLRTHVVDEVLRHVNNGYCSLLEPKQISGNQFAEWITGRNPATYVAVHYIKLIDFTFDYVPAWKLARITATGQRGIVGAKDGPTWDSVQMQMVYHYSDGREAAFDIHTSWVLPDNFPGYVEQEVQFRFDNGVWNAHQRRRGVEVTVENQSPQAIKYTPNHHYNATFTEPWGEQMQRGYGIEILRRFFEEVAFVEFGRTGKSPDTPPATAWLRMQSLTYNDLLADRNTVAVVQAVEVHLAPARARSAG